MSDELLPYYDRELGILRGLAAEFAERHPKIAGRLALGRDESQDPHVERLVQAFAFLAARIHRRLDDDFPELTDALLGLLYPHFLEPVPSMAVVEMAFDPKQAAVTSPHRVPRGTMLETEPVDDETCLYRTCFDVDLLPVKIVSARLAGPPFRLPLVPPAGTAAVLQFTVETLSDAVEIGQLPLDRLRLHLHAGSGGTAFELYELLLTRAVGVTVGPPTGAAGARPARQSLLLPATALRPAGFDRTEAAIGTDPRSFPGYRLLSEFFAFPQKFLFVDLVGVNQTMTAGCGRRLEISILLEAGGRDLERAVSAETIRLGCTPVVNLFPLRLDPLRLDGRQTESCVVPDARRPAAVEIHSLKSVRGVRPGGQSFDIRPFYGPSHGSSGADRDESAAWWIAARRPRREPRPDGTVDAAGDVWISVVDDAGGPQALADVTLMIEAQCLNRNLPTRLPFAVGRPRLQLRDGQGPVGRITCLNRPTRTLRPVPGRGASWRLVSHLSLNHLSLVDAGDGAAGDALREVLRLYLLDDLDDYEQRSRWIEGIVGVSGRRVAARVPGPLGGVCRGVEVRLVLDDDNFADGAGYLFSSVLERFLGAWVSLNSFTRLVAASRQRESRQEEWRWPPRAGNRVLV
jgi:type VI secretion system protein ImpG